MASLKEKKYASNLVATTRSGSAPTGGRRPRSSQCEPSCARIARRRGTDMIPTAPASRTYAQKRDRSRRAKSAMPNEKRRTMR